MCRDLHALKRENLLLAERMIEQQEPFNKAMPWRLTLINSRICNLHCIMCEIHRRPEIEKHVKVNENVLPFESFKKVAEETFPFATEVIPTTMGEPLLIPYFNEMLDLMEKFRVKLNLTTNGTLLRPSISERIVPLLSDVKVSFDGATRETYERIRRGADFDKVIENIRYLNSIREKTDEKGPTITFQVTLMRENIEELPELVELAYDLGLDRVKGYHVYVFDEEFKDQSLLFHRDLSNRKIEEAEALAKRYGITSQFPAPFNLDGGKTCRAGILKSCDFLWKETWIEYNGDVAPCCVPAGPTKRPVMGNMHEQTFREIWNCPRYQQLRRTHHTDEPTFPHCKNCSLRTEFHSAEGAVYDENAFLTYQKEGGVQW